MIILAVRSLVLITVGSAWGNVKELCVLACSRRLDKDLQVQLVVGLRLDLGLITVQPAAVLLNQRLRLITQQTAMIPLNLDVLI